MKWTSRYENVGKEPNQQRVLVHFSDCSRYAITRSGRNRYFLVESNGFGSSYYVTLDKGKSEHVTLRAAKSQAEEEEAVRLKIWHYFMEQAERTMIQKSQVLKDDSSVCLLVRNELKERENWTVEQHASDSYAYAKHRANLRNSAEDYSWVEYIDGYARRTWKAMVDGVYKQWWE